MARKRASDPPQASRAQQPRNDDLKPHHRKSPRDLSPDNKIDNLKTLNQLLLKETMEKRFQVDQLKSHIDDIEESHPFASDLEREVSRIVMASAMAEEAKKVESLRDILGSVRRENDGMRKELGSVVKERDSMKTEIGELEVKMKDLEVANVEIRERLGLVVAEKDEVERLWRKKEEGFDALKEMMEDLEKAMEEMSGDHEKEAKGLRADLEANVARILELDDEGRRLLDVNGSLEAEIRDSKEMLGLLRREGDGLRSKVIELEQRNGEAVGELDRLRADVLVLEKDKEALVRESEAKARALELKVAELSKNLGEISREKDGIEMVRSRQEAEILELEIEAEKMRLNVVELERLCADSGGKNARLVDENDVMKKEFALLEKGFEAKVGEMSMKLDDLVANMRAISLEKDEVENARAKQDVEIARLKKEVEMLGVNVSELQDERDAVERELGVQREESGRLCLQVEDMKMSRDEHLKELKQLNASLEAVLSEKNEGVRCIEALTKEKAALQDSLSAAKESSELLTKKMRAAEVLSEKVLSSLKRTAEAMNEAEIAQQNGAIDDEEIHPFAKELESIKCAFTSRVARMEEMGRELGVLQADLENAKKKKKKPSLLLWLYPASTVAAILVAYAARGR